MRVIDLIEILIISLLMISASGCSKTSSVDRSINLDNTISGAVSTATISISESADDSNSSTGSAAVAFNENSSKVLQNKGYRKLLYSILDMVAGGRDLYASSLFSLCSSGGTGLTIIPAASWGNSSATELYAELSYNDCVIKHSNYTATGSVLFHWSNLTTGTDINKIQSTTKIEQAFYNKELTNYLSDAVISVEGTGTTLLSDNTLTGGTLSNLPVAHTIEFISVSPPNIEYNLIISLEHIKTRSGNTIFDHKVTTVTALDIVTDLTAQTRKIKSGELEVEHVISGFTVDIVYSDVVYSIGDPRPVSGTLTVTVTGSRTGGGTITFDGTTTPDVSGPTGDLPVSIVLDL